MQLGHVKLNPTNDHVHPESKGGRETIMACIQCNMIKADMLPEQWAAFMEATPEWWKLNKWDIRRARHAMNLLTPGFEAGMNTRRDRKAAGLTRSGKPKPVIVPPELIWHRAGLIAATAAQDARLLAIDPVADVSRSDDSGGTPGADAGVPACAVQA